MTIVGTTPFTKEMLLRFVVASGDSRGPPRPSCSGTPPVWLIALAEGALTGFTDEIFDIPHVTAARDLFIDIPGPETDRLAALARQYETYIIVQCKARWPEVIERRFFNVLFVLAPS